jgi:hypothetical protein
MVVTNFGGIEETLRYLDWQLQAYSSQDFSITARNALTRRSCAEARYGA